MVPSGGKVRRPSWSMLAFRSWFGVGSCNNLAGDILDHKVSVSLI